MSDLKPCPFCGTEAKRTPGPIREWAWCPNCSGTHLEKDWNSRPVEDALRAEVEVEKNRGFSMSAELEWNRNEVARLREQLERIAREAEEED